MVNKKRGGRPPIEIDKKSFEGLCAIQCTLSEVADFFKCSEDTIQRWCRKTYGRCFAVVFGQKRSVGKVSLRRSQFRLAEKNATMAIWLGKQYLGQKDVERHEITGADGKPVETKSENIVRVYLPENHRDDKQ